jgi:integrase
MLTKLRHVAVKVRAKNSGSKEEKFTGSVTYAVVGLLDKRRVRHALGTDNAKLAARRVDKISTACAIGPSSSLWAELQETLPARTFELFANAIGYVLAEPVTANARPVWNDLLKSFEIEMERLIANKGRGASREEGIMVSGTRDRYASVYKHFGDFLTERGIVYLDTITPAVIEIYKTARVEAIAKLKQSRGGTSVALDVAALHRIFKYAVSKGLMASKPIDLSRESKPGKNPKNGARSFTATELKAMRDSAGDDLFAFTLLRWTGLRVSDAVNLTWGQVHFDRGANGEIEVLTQKRNKIAIIPLSSELHNVLQDAVRKLKPHPRDRVLLNPDTGKPFTSRARLYHRMKSLGTRAGVTRVTPHCFRDTFICDMLARGCSTFVVGQMVADTTDTIEKHYASFVPAARDAAQHQMDSGLGIEERAKIAAQRGNKVVGIRGAV